VVRGAVALAVAGMLIKISTLLLRIPLTLLIGSEGLGIYQMALPAFYALYHVAAGGVPMAIQNLVSEYYAKGRVGVAEQVLRLGLGYTNLVGGVAACVLLIGAPILARLLGEERAYWSLVAVAPAVLLFAVDSVYRNYLQGRNLMTPSATASLLEQGTKIVVTLGVAQALIPMGREYAAAGATLGITLGAFVSMLYMVYIYRRVRREDNLFDHELEARSILIRRIFRLAWPVTLGSITMPVLSLIDVGVVQRGFLKAGYDQSAATSLYGAYQGIAVQVVWFPVVLTNALGNALFPTLTAAVARGDSEMVQERVQVGLRAAALICLPSAVGLSVLAGPIARLFGEPQAAVPLLYMAPVALLGPLTWLMIAQLQALGETARPMRNITIALAIKIVLDGILAPIKGIDVKGVALASVIMFAIALILNARDLERKLDISLPWGRLLQGPLVASLVMGLGLVGLAKSGLLPESGWASLMAILAVAPVIYIATLLATRAVTKQELASMGGPLASRLERWLQVFWPWS